MFFCIMNNSSKTHSFKHEWSEGQLVSILCFTLACSEVMILIHPWDSSLFNLFNKMINSFIDTFSDSFCRLSAMMSHWIIHSTESLSYSQPKKSYHLLKSTKKVFRPQVTTEQFFVFCKLLRIIFYYDMENVII